MRVLPLSAATEEEQPDMTAKTFAGLKLWGIGPALMSGRIADIAIDPGDPVTWYVAVGSGGVWKTGNRAREFLFNEPNGMPPLRTFQGTAASGRA